LSVIDLLPKVVAKAKLASSRILNSISKAHIQKMSDDLPQPVWSDRLPKRVFTSRIVVAMSVLVIVAGLVGHLMWTKSPSYSLKQVRRAIVTHDLVTFDKYVDTETLVSRFVDQILAEHLKEQQASDANAEWSMNLAQGLIQAIKPQLVAGVEQQIKSLVEQGSVTADDELKDDSAVDLVSLFQDSEDTRLDFDGVKGVSRDGNISMVTLAFYQRRIEEELQLEVKMRKLDGYWQVAELPNASAFIKKAEEMRDKLLAEQNQPIAVEIAKAVIVRSAIKSESSDSWNIERRAVFRITLQNIGTKGIKTVNGLITARDKIGNTINAFRFSDDEGIAAGMEVTRTWSIATNQFIAEEARLYETPDEDMEIDVTFQQVRFDDESELQLLSTLNSSD
jgi:hypothetical protein